VWTRFLRPLTCPGISNTFEVGPLKPNASGNARIDGSMLMNSPEKLLVHEQVPVAMVRFHPGTLFVLKTNGNPKTSSEQSWRLATSGRFRANGYA
jgi:hypothetical protein